MAQKNAGRSASHAPAPTYNLSRTSIAHRADIIRVVGEWVAPAGRRHQWWTSVICPACLQQHMHTDARRPGRHGWLRGCPTTGTAYRIVTEAVRRG